MHSHLPTKIISGLSPPIESNPIRKTSSSKLSKEIKKALGKMNQNFIDFKIPTEIFSISTKCSQMKKEMMIENSR